MSAKTKDIQALIDLLLSSKCLHESAHFSSHDYEDEPILTTGRQMTSYLPEQYRHMRAISRWQEDDTENTSTRMSHGRWLTEAELFYRQATYMADWEDNCPYHGSFKAYCPTYSAMSDRQLRGYFTWRAATRAGHVEAASPAFAFIYTYELLCGISVKNPEAGLLQLQHFWQQTRSWASDLDSVMPIWLMDYAAWHNLDAAPLASLPTLKHDLALTTLANCLEKACTALPTWQPRELNPWHTVRKLKTDAEYQLPSARRKPTSRPRARASLHAGVPPLGEELEHEFFDALDSLSSWSLAKSTPFAKHPDDVRHLCCAVFLRLADHYDARRKAGLLESLFGALIQLPYAMFSSAVFFCPDKHANCTWHVGPLRHYCCKDNSWSCARLPNIGNSDKEIGSIMRATIQALAIELGYTAYNNAPFAYKDKGKQRRSTPKYLQKIILEEVAARRSWTEAHKPISIDLGQLADIRSAAAQTREALLVDEEREEVPTVVSTAAAAPIAAPASALVSASAPTTRVVSAPAPAPAAAPASATPAAATPLSPAQTAYLGALLAGNRAGCEAVLQAAGCTEDLLVDAINEALFDALGDTAVEFDDGKAQLVEDYREDVERILGHE